jgi:hypothetical protein
MTNLLKLNDDDWARTVIWGHVLQECLEIIGLLKFAHKHIDPQAKLDNQWAGPHGDSKIVEAVNKHMRQHLTTKLKSVFEKRGNGHDETSKAVAENGIIFTWRPHLTSCESQGR